MRPSVMKQAAQIKPVQKGQKRTRKAADTFAVAAVNGTPLNSASGVQEELLQELPCKRKEVSSPSSRVGAQMSLVVPRSPLSSPVVTSRSAMEAPASSSSSAMDEFDELLNTFFGYYHKFNCELDPGKGFNNLLLELNEVIDS